jgi:predicted dehydrogenase/nucleoside-diphosphate-sugar epimerase
MAAGKPLTAPDARPTPVTTAKPVRVALVGCGAVSRTNLLPVLAGHDGISLRVLVDRDEKRARALAQAYQVSDVLTDGDRLDREDVDAVILATPPAHHARAAIACASKGLHVFVEKPMAISAADARAMVQAAEDAGVALSVGLYRRFLPCVRLLRELIERGEFGRPLAVDAEEGGPYGWQLATLDSLTRTAGGGGVLIDLGSHVIDLILYVLSATPVVERYLDNSRGGIETDCLLHSSLQTPYGVVPFRLELSRTRELRGTIRVECEHATIELLRGNFTELLVHRHHAPGSAAPIRFSAAWTHTSPFLGYEAFRQEIDDWVTAMAQGTEPILSGRSVVPVVGLIEDAYRSRAVLPEPWTDEGLRAPVVRQIGTNGKRVLVTGAGGFLGGRAVELLRERYGCDPVALVREPKSAARLARWPVEIVVGDICSRADMDRVLAGCDAVVHCAVGTSWRREEVRKVTVDGTRVVAEAALAAGIKRFVHISTLFVHQREGVSRIDEDVPLAPPARDTYGRNKLEAERAVVALTRRGLSAIVLRPTRIYGPFSRTFTERPLKALAEGRLVIGGNADVPANMVYVDNVVEAIACALQAAESLSGSAYLISDADQVSLREFYGFFAQSAGATLRLVPGWREQAPSARAGVLTRWLSAFRTIARSPELRGLVRRIMDTDPVGALPRHLWNRSPAFQQSMLRRFGADAAVIYRPATADSSADLVYHGEPALVSTGKAEKELGFTQPIPRARAMALTLEWARYARLLPE